MKILDLPALAGERSFLDRLRDVLRRQGWLMEHLTVPKLRNLFVAGVQFCLKHESMRAWPVMVKIDISPLCNIRCPSCVHAMATENSRVELRRQTFNVRQKMPVDRYTRIIEAIANKTMAVSLYYVGDPLVHPDLDSMCGIARRAGLNVHVSTNFSFKLSDSRIQSLVTSGLTHLTVCVDGMSQETYELTRTGGQLALVLDNLRRVVAARKALGQRFPRIEVQYIVFQHNAHQLPEARGTFAALGVDQFTAFWGDLHNYTDISPGTFEVKGPKTARLVPRCVWPHFTMLIKHDGDTVPCANYRMGPQYSAVGEKRVAGNVFETSVWQVWNSPEYRRLRRIVSNPARASREPELSRTFCDGCSQVFDTDVRKNMRPGSTHRLETNRAVRELPPTRDSP